MPAGSNSAFRRRWMVAIGAASGVNTPCARRSALPPRNSVAWPPSCCAWARMWLAGASQRSQRSAPPHSIACAPGNCSGSAVEGTLTRHSGRSTRSSGLKNRWRWSRTPRHSAPAPSASICSPACAPVRRVVAASTAASAPDRRTYSSSLTHSVPEIGSGWPLHSFMRASASSCDIAKRSVRSATGRGSTLIDRSSSTPSVPSEPVSRRATS
jgi:hypothetical protein